MSQENTTPVPENTPVKPAPVATTHAISTPNKKAATPIDVLKIQMEDKMMKNVTSYYGGNKEKALTFVTASVDYIRRIPKLLECDRVSLFSALVQSAQFNFMPSGVMGEAYIIPYGTEAKFQIGYQGIVTLLYRAKVKAITANIVYKNDDFSYEEGLNPILFHKPAPFGTPRGEAVGVYTIAQLERGVKTFKVMDKEAVMNIKALSKAKASKDSPWNSDKDPELWMWKKTCLIQHAKMLPKTQELQKAIEADYEGEGMDRGNLDAGGIAVAPALHLPTQNEKTTDTGTEVSGQ